MVQAFETDCVAASLSLGVGLITRSLAALESKRFLILTGLSGSGKTKVAQAIARWLSPALASGDPFIPGATIEGARKVYTITRADRLGVEAVNDENTKVLLPRAIIEQWADYIEAHNVPQTIGPQELRDQIKKGGGEYSDHLQNMESHYKPAAFALVKARKNHQPVKCYDVIPFAADWTGNENIIGYPDGLNEGSYVTRPALDLIQRAIEPANALVPHFLILDEMNLSHVERYFSDILSAIESEEQIPLYKGSIRKSDGKDVPHMLSLPPNVFIIGTVNVDETTYMFSPKVLDRANVIEFRMNASELGTFLTAPKAPNLAALDGKGAAYGKAFVEAAADKSRSVPSAAKQHFESEMVLLFNLLKDHHAEFGYRTVYESARFIHFYHLFSNYSDNDEGWFAGAMDAVIVQKILPKLHGARSRLEGLLWALARVCSMKHQDRNESFAEELRVAGMAQEEAAHGPEAQWAKLARGE